MVTLRFCGTCQQKVTEHGTGHGTEHGTGHGTGQDLRTGPGRFRFSYCFFPLCSQPLFRKPTKQGLWEKCIEMYVEIYVFEN